jgi:hypothetical protein
MAIALLGFEPFGPLKRPTDGKAAIGWRACRSSVTRNKSRPHALAFRIIREAVMQLRSGLWPDYDPLALAVLVVGILAIATWAVGF